LQNIFNVSIVASYPVLLLEEQVRESFSPK
jgi:hypothetical protein